MSRVYTDQAVFSVGPAGASVLDLFGVTLDELRAATGLALEENR